MRPAALRVHLVVLGAYVLLSLLLLAPVLPHFDRAILGGPVAAVDAWQNVWNLWWVEQALSSGTSPFHTPYLYYPTGVDLHLQTLNVSNGVLVAPITALFGPVAGYNAAVLLAFVLAGVGGYALSLHVSGQRLPAFVGGLLFAFSPFHLTKLWDGQLELIALQWLAFYALFLLRAADLASEQVRWPRRLDALLAGFFLALIGYTSWYYLLFFAVYSMLFATVWLVSTPGWMRRAQLLAQMALVALVAVLLLLPILLPALSDVQGTPVRINPRSSLDLILIHSANLFDLGLPSYLHPLWGTAVYQVGQSWHPFIAGWNLSLGYTGLALALLGGLVAWRVAWRWWLLTLAALLLALGPLLHVGTLRTGLYLPYALLLDLPGVGVARRPSHFVVIATLLLAPLAALGLRWLLARVATAYRPLLLAALLFLLVVEYAPPRWPVLFPVVHPYYATLVGAPGALMDLPPRNESSGPLQAQMLHTMPMFGGFVSRPPSYPFVKQAPAIRELWAMRPELSHLLPLSVQQKQAALAFYDVQQVVVHWNLVEPARRADLAAVLDGILGDAPAYADDQLSAYALPPVPPVPFAYFGAGWYPEEHAEDRHWRWMQSQAELVLVNPTAAALPVTLDLQAQSYQQPRAVDLALNGQPLATWPVALAPQVRQLRLLLPPGEHRLSLQAPAAPEDGGERSLSIVLTEAVFRAQSVVKTDATLSFDTRWSYADRP